MSAIGHGSRTQEQVHELISTLRKALSQQKQLEERCRRANLPIDYRWSLNTTKLNDTNSKDSVLQ